MPSISAPEAHLSTLEEITHRNPFELVDSPWGTIEAWRASTMATGTMGALAQVADIVRNDAAELQEKSVAFDAKKASVLRTVNKLLSFMSRVDALTSRVEALEEKRKADEAVQCKLDEEPIELPPDISEKQTLAPPAEIGDQTHAPGGELHAVAPPKEEEPSSELAEPPLETEGDEQQGDELGDLSAKLRDLPDPVPEPRGSVYPQPVSISLNKE